MQSSVPAYLVVRLAAQKHSVCKVKFFFELLGNIASLFCCKYVIKFNRLLGGSLWEVFGKYDCECRAHVDFALFDEDFSFVILFDDAFCQ